MHERWRTVLLWLIAIPVPIILILHYTFHLI
jgi:hypothetical protein